MTQFPSGVRSDLKVIGVKLACSACSRILENYENVLIKPMGKEHLAHEKEHILY